MLLMFPATPDMEPEMAPAADVPAADIWKNADTVARARDETIVSAMVHRDMTIMAAADCADMTCMAEDVPCAANDANPLEAPASAAAIAAPIPAPTPVNAAVTDVAADCADVTIAVKLLPAPAVPEDRADVTCEPRFVNVLRTLSAAACAA